jgi:DNA-binding NarL/FixJ family response regulator
VDGEPILPSGAVLFGKGRSVEECYSLEEKRMLPMFLKKLVNLAEVLHVTASAKAKIQNNSYDVVVLDKGLPDGDGIDLISEIKDLAWGCHHPHI